MIADLDVRPSAAGHRRRPELVVFEAIRLTFPRLVTKIDLITAVHSTCQRSPDGSPTPYPESTVDIALTRPSRGL